MTSEDGFRQDLQDDPTDWALRMIFADWLTDQGRYIEANGQKWQATWQRRPLPCDWHGGYGDGNAGGPGWRWFDGLAEEWGEDDPRSNLPVDVFDCLQSGLPGRSAKRYSTLVEAEHALAVALAELQMPFDVYDPV